MILSRLFENINRINIDKEWLPTLPYFNNPCIITCSEVV